jgi:4-hydroxy-3-methylbut-2-enyl diphosphate reductase
MGIEFLLPPGAAGDRLAAVGPEDVVLIPAFGVEHDDFLRLGERGSILVDTTCGSVLTVWKSVEKYARNGITSVVHGKVEHEETRATCSQVRKYPEAHYLVVRDKEQTRTVCRFLEGDLSAARLLEELHGACSAGFDPERHLERIGLANQTTMLSTESLEIAQMLRVSMAKRSGEAEMAERFHSFDTICSATQDRQDAVNELIDQGCDLMLVIGGFNSSNTTHLVEIASHSTRAYHIEDAENLISPQWIRHKPLNEAGAVIEEGWLPSGRLVVGLTAGASTPNSEIGRSITRLLAFRGVSEAELRELAAEGARISASRGKAKPAPPGG